jgi:hypothetical protein
MTKFNDAFWKWFGDSKVVDADGNPLVVYHGTNALEFSRFKRRLGDIGIHFGTIGQAEDRAAYRDEYMKDHSESSNGLRLIPVFLSIQNPLRLPDMGAWNADKLDYKLADMFYDAKEIIGRARTANAKTAACRDVIERHGYDGVVYKNEGETAGAIEIRARIRQLAPLIWKSGEQGVMEMKPSDSPEYLAYSQARKAYEDYRKNKAEDSYIAFYPEQIKSAIGNDGSWNKNDPDMRSNPRRSRR